MNDESRWSGSRWSEPRGGGAERRGADPLEQRLDRWVSAGRQLVDGVSGARPGSRPAARGGPGRSGSRSGSRPRLDNLGRWMEDKLDWLLEDGDDWREPWEQPEAADPRPTGTGSRVSGSASTGSGAERRSARRPLEAISRRGTPALQPEAAVDAAAAAGWPSDDDFSLPRWQRPSGPAPSRTREESPGPQPPSGPPAAIGRPLPRSSRRRPA